MASDSPDYKKLFLEERRRREEAERLQEGAERLSRKTTLQEFLDACHRHLFLGLTIQKAESSTQGSPENAKDKVRPHNIVAWTEFAELMDTVWQRLRKHPDFFQQRGFSTLSHLQGSGDIIRRKQMSSEVDLSYYATNTVENMVEEVVSLINAHPLLRQEFNMEGTVSFESHSNMLSPEELLQVNLEQMTLAGTEEQPRRSIRLAQRHPPWIGARQAQAVQPTRPPSTHADRICVYRKARAGTGNHQIVPVFPIEYKPPHKVPLGLIMEGLGDMDVDQVLRIRPDESVHEKRRYLVAAIITQAYSYMIEAGLAYGYVYTGEAIIFLHVPEHDYGTVQYFLSVPQNDVGDSTGWSANDTHCENKLHLTAVGQVLAFTLQALATPARGSTWRRNAKNMLPTWTVVLEELLEQPGIASPSPEDSPYQPSPRRPGERKYMEMFPVMTRSRSALLAGRSCNPASEHPTQVDQGSDDDDDDTFDPETPTRPAVQQTSRTQSAAHQEQSADASSSASPSGATQDCHLTRRPFCTQACLRGLQQGLPLDEHCPNVQDHRQGLNSGNRHRINQQTLLRLLHRELAGTNPLLEELGFHGARGCLVKVVLGSHGYTMVAKGTRACHFEKLKHEEIIYRHLDALQDKYIPVCLGMVDMRKAPFSYWAWGLAEIVHFLVLSFAGQPDDCSVQVERTQLQAQAQAQAALQAIHARNVTHNDVASRNMVYHAEAKHVQIFDFDRAVILDHSAIHKKQRLNQKRFVLGAISPNQKWKKAPGPGQKSQSPKILFERDMAALEKAFA